MLELALVLACRPLLRSSPLLACLQRPFRPITTSAMAPTQNGEKVNGTSTVDAVNGASPTTPIDIGERLASKTKPRPSALKIKPATADKQGVANAFERYAQVIHARAKPLPTQAGAGTFYETKRWGKLRDDIKALRSAGTLTRTIQARSRDSS